MDKEKVLLSKIIDKAIEKTKKYFLENSSQEDIDQQMEEYGHIVSQDTDIDINIDKERIQKGEIDFSVYIDVWDDYYQDVILIEDLL